MDLTALKETVNQCLEDQDLRGAVQTIRDYYRSTSDDDLKMPLDCFQEHFARLLYDAMRYGDAAPLFGSTTDQNKVDHQKNRAIQSLIRRYGKQNIRVLFQDQHIISRDDLIHQLKRMLHLSSDSTIPTQVDWASVRHCLRYAHHSRADYLRYCKFPDQRRIMHSLISEVSLTDLRDVFHAIRQMNVEAISEHVEH